jgi:hypothetical protein
MGACGHAQKKDKEDISHSESYGVTSPSIDEKIDGTSSTVEDDSSKVKNDRDDEIINLRVEIIRFRQLGPVSVAGAPVSPPGGTREAFWGSKNPIFIYFHHSRVRNSEIGPRKNRSFFSEGIFMVGRFVEQSRETGGPDVTRSSALLNSMIMEPRQGFQTLIALFSCEIIKS